MSELKPINIKYNDMDIAHTVHIAKMNAKIEELKAKNAQLEDDVAFWKKKLSSCLNGDCILTCDTVEKYGKENVRLKRALWLARAERASDKARIFYFNDLETKLDIDGFSYDSKKKKGHKKLTARDWRITWLKVERKCRAKAEEYK